MPNEALLQLRKFVAPEFVFGPGASELAGRYARNLGMDRVMLATDQGVIDSGWADTVQKALKQAGVETVLFNEISPNPRDYECMAGAELFMSTECDGIVAVGGGSVMDCAKGVGIVCSNNRHVLDFEGVDNVDHPSPPLVCIPTTAGSSADVSQFAIINDTNRKVKIAIVSKIVVPDVALIDPALTTTMTRSLTVNTGLDALTHAIEAYVSNANAPITDLFALEAVRLVNAYLPRVVEDPENVELRSEVMLGSMFAGLAFSNAILGAVHAMAHSLGGLKDLPHGQCNAILLEHVIDYNFESEAERYCNIGVAMGARIDSSMSMDQKREAVMEAVRSLKKKLGVTAGLSEMGVTLEDLDGLAEKAVKDPCMATNPMAPDVSDIRKIYEKAL